MNKRLTDCGELVKQKYKTKSLNIQQVWLPRLLDDNSIIQWGKKNQLTIQQLGKVAYSQKTKHTKKKPSKKKLIHY